MAVVGYGNGTCLDFGSYSLRAGALDSEIVTVNERSVAGKQKLHPTMIGLNYQSRYVGSAAMERKALLEIESPVERGVVRDWDGWEALMTHVLENDEFGFNPSEYPLVFTMPILNPLKNEENIVERLFETFRLPACAATLVPVVSKMSTGWVTGTLVEIGHGLIQIVCFDDGVLLEESVQRIPFGGQDLTEYMARAVSEGDVPISLLSDSNWHLAGQIKEEVIEVAFDYDAALQNTAESTENRGSYVFRDGTPIDFIAHRYRVAEALFKPNLVGREHPSLSKLIIASILKSPIDSRKALYNKIFITGGGANISKLADRLQFEIIRFSPGAHDVNIIINDHKQYSALYGAAILGALSRFADHWFTKSDYDEQGPKGIWKPENLLAGMRPNY
jgi:actin-related protein